jgi:hypothetical protein
VIALLRDEGLLSEERIALLLSWRWLERCGAGWRGAR